MPVRFNSRKIIALLAVLIMMFSFASCVAKSVPAPDGWACGEQPEMTLDKYKTTMLAELQAYGEVSAQGFAEHIWQQICDVLGEAKTKIDEAEDMPIVDVVVADARRAVQLMAWREAYNVKRFLTVSEAYAQGVVSHEDLQSVLYYAYGMDANINLGNIEHGFVPVPQSFDVFLDAAAQSELRKDYDMFFRGLEVELENLGIYNGYFAVRVELQGMFPALYYPPLEVDGLKIPRGETGSELAIVFWKQ